MEADGNSHLFHIGEIVWANNEIRRRLRDKFGETFSVILVTAGSYRLVLDAPRVTSAKVQASRIPGEASGGSWRAATRAKGTHHSAAIPVLWAVASLHK